MKSGKCPKCGSTNVYKETNGIYIPKMLGTFVRTDSGNMGSSSEDYVCTDCGYYERYIADRDKLKQVAKVWKKVG
jgi:hypothetical protein